MDQNTENMIDKENGSAFKINVAISRATGLMTDGWSPTYDNPDNANYDQEAEPLDFCNDLNAMHEAEETLSWEEHALYAEALDVRLGKLEAISATAKQRAESFLRAKGLWEE